MNKGLNSNGLVVPMVTPVTKTAHLIEPALNASLIFLLAGGVDGISFRHDRECVSVPQTFRFVAIGSFECAVPLRQTGSPSYVGRAM